MDVLLDNNNKQYDEVIKHHKSPYYFNFGEITCVVLIGALTISIALVFNAAVMRTYQSIANDPASAWIAFIIVLISALFLILILYHCKKPMMQFAHHFRLLHS